jgi:D-alanyl-lipoteichoic acid acyltransferase DltB (MBOAT superfamily)
MSGLTLLIATGFFAYQIYCDFSGYSDIAIGSAKILGIDLMENFKRPYFSTSIKEFWSRWHISLSSWFRDYVYIPLGGSKKGSVRTYVNILIVFLISGLWHGASWMFIIWGATHGLYQLYEKATFNIRAQLWKNSRLDGTWIQWSIKWIVTMCLVFISWVFFRSDNLDDALTILNRIIDIRLISLQELYLALVESYITRLRLIVVLIAALVIEIGDLKADRFVYPIDIKKVIMISIMIWMIVLFGSFGLEEFIYFQF